MRLKLRQAESDFSVANSPLFLLRKLRVDPAVLDIATHASGETIFGALRKSLSKKPETIGHLVRPYVYLVALSMKPDLSYLHKAAVLNTPNHKWFGYLAKVLIDTYRSTSNATIVVAASPSSTATSTSVSTATSDDIQTQRDK